MRMIFMAVSKAQRHWRIVTLVLHSPTKQIGSLMLRMGQKITKFLQESVSFGVLMKVTSKLTILPFFFF